MEKNIKKFWIVIIGTILGVTLILSRFTNIFSNKTSCVKYDEFLYMPVNFDVLFCGSSHMIEGINPMAIWDNYGITSYNLGNHASQIAVSYYTLLNAIDYTNPKVVVLDLYTIGYESKLSDNLSYLHTTLDAFPMSKNKLRAINDLCNDLEDKLGFCFPIVAYHNNWSTLYADNFKEYAHKTFKRGAELYYTVVPNLEKPAIPDTKERYHNRTISMDYLDKIVELCRERGIELLLVTIPCMQNTEGLVANNYAYDLSNQNEHVEYIDLMSMDIVDYNYDFMDEVGHLNFSGAAKVSAFVGDYLRESYKLVDYRTNDAFGIWRDDYEKYFSIISNDMCKSMNIYAQLLIMSDSNYKCNIVLKDNGIYEDALFKNLTNNIHNKTIEIDEKLDRDCIISVYNSKNDELIGKFSYVIKEDKTIMRVD